MVTHQHRNYRHLRHSAVSGIASTNKGKVRPNPVFKRTRIGMPHLALISFWAKCVLPLRAAYNKRYAS